MLSTGISADKIDPEPIIVQLSEAGYVCRLDEARISVQKKGYLNFEIYAEDKGLILRAHFPLSEKIKTEEAKFYKLINKINSECKCAKYYSKNGKLFVEAFYPLPYVKKDLFLFYVSMGRRFRSHDEKQFISSCRIREINSLSFN
jgi:hypothetical protein